MYPSVNSLVGAPVCEPVTMQEVAARLGVSVRTVQIRVKNGLMPPGKRVCGGKRRTWHRDEFEVWFDGEHRSGPIAVDSFGAVALAPPPLDAGSVVTAPIAQIPPPDATPTTEQVAVSPSPRLEMTASIKRMQARIDRKLQQIDGD